MTQLASVGRRNVSHGFKSCPGVVLALASPLPAAQQTAPATTPPGIQLQTGEYTWKFGGYIKVDVIHDFDEIGSTDSFDVRTIPTSGPTADGDATRIHARQTRFNVDVQGPSSAGPLRAFAEGDFFSDQNGFRLRHAYGTVGEVLGGQTWTTFMDEAAMPETLDFESPTAFPLVRQAQVRRPHVRLGQLHLSVLRPGLGRNRVAARLAPDVRRRERIRRPPPALPQVRSLTRFLPADARGCSPMNPPRMFISGGETPGPRGPQYNVNPP